MGMLTASLAELLHSRLTTRGIAATAADAYDLAELVEDAFEVEEVTQEMPGKQLLELRAASRTA